MALMALVSLIAFSIIGFVTLDNARTSIDNALHTALEEGGGKADIPFLGNSGDSLVPAYSVTVTRDGTIYADANLTARMDADVLSQAVASVLNASYGKSGTVSGRVSDYSLYYMVSGNSIGYRIAFVDSSSYDQTVAHTVMLLGSGWVILMLVLLVITLFLSRYVTRPVVAAWENQQRFIADASHELKTPLTVILADATILSENPTKTIGEQHEWVEGILSEGERMRRLTEDMLTLAQAEAGDVAAPTMSRIDLSQLTERAVLQFEPAAFERGLMIEDDIDGGIFVMGSADRLDSMLKTLLENACKYGAGSNSPIKVALKRDHSHAVLKVSNGGQTIPEEDLPHIFERFYRSDKSRVSTGESASFGLGLSIAKSTAELHKGSIAAESTQGQTTFVVKLPILK